MVQRVVEGTSVLLQWLGGTAIVGVVSSLLLQESGNAIEIDGTLAAAYGAISALFTFLMWSVRNDKARCEKREDDCKAREVEMWNLDKEKTIVVKDQTAATLKAAEVTSAAVTAATMSLEETRKNGAKLESLATHVTVLQAAMTELTTTLERQGSTRTP